MIFISLCLYYSTMPDTLHVTFYVYNTCHIGVEGMPKCQMNRCRLSQFLEISWLCDVHSPILYFLSTRRYTVLRLVVISYIPSHDTMANNPLVQIFK